MKALHIASKDITGGAPRASYRLHQGLLLSGVDSNILVEIKDSNDGNVIAYKKSTALKDRLLRYYRNFIINLDFIKYKNCRPRGLELFSDARSRYRDSFQEYIESSDVINLHWTAGFLDYQAFFSQLPPGKPIIWTLHDMNPFTGGCHYSGDCGKFNKQCGTCPQLGSKREFDLSRSVWLEKNEALSHKAANLMHIVTPSSWLANQAKDSSLFGGLPVSTIPYGIDTDLFQPRDTCSFRETLKIPADALVVGFVADSTANKRKGFNYLKEAFEEINSENIYLVSVGKSTPVISKKLNHIHLGSIQSDSLLSMVYSLFDIYVCASVEDNLPNTIIESLACGTPVVGFDIGGVPDMVESGQTGILASDISADSLAASLNDIIDDKCELDAMAKKCREKAVSEYALHIQAEKYSSLYTSLI